MSNRINDYDLSRTALKKLREGAPSFNQWRAGLQDQHLDLHGSDLSKLDLSNVNLSSVRLKGSNFLYTNLEGALLAGANLNGALLSKTNLKNADLRQARMERAKLNGAELDGCNLYGTIRESWKVSNVKCAYCWITRDKANSPSNPNRFQDGEFEITYGGYRFSVCFPDGFQAVDLLGLPYYASRIIKEYPDRKVTLVSVSTIGEPKLEFRIDEPLSRLEKESLDSKSDEMIQCLRNQLSLSLHVNMNLSETNNSLQKLLERIYERPTLTISVGQLNFNWNEYYNDIDKDQLTTELNELISALKTNQEYDAANDVDMAVEALKNNNPQNLKDYLIKAGGKAFDIATKIATPLAVEVIKKAVGL